MDRLAPLRVCPECRCLSREESRICPQCGAPLRGGGPWLRRLAGAWLRWRRTRRAATYLLLGALAAVYLLTLAVGFSFATGDDPFAGEHRALLELGSMTPSLTLDGGQGWRVICAIFLHGGVWHVLFNGWALRDLGWLTETVTRGRVMWTTFFLTGLAGNLASLAWKAISENPAGSVGASGGVCGLLGFLLGTYRQRQGGVNEQLGRDLLRWFAFIAVFGLFMSNIDNAAHFGGAAAGFLFSFVAWRPQLRSGPRALSFWNAAAALCAAACLVSFFFAWRHFGKNQSQLLRLHAAIALERESGKPERQFVRDDMLRLAVLMRNNHRSPLEEAEYRELLSRFDVPRNFDADPRENPRP